jgi:hypothetical protein
MRASSGRPFWTSSVAKADVTRGGAMGNLSESERKVIARRINDLVLKQFQTGVSTSAKVICHNCGYAKPLAGTIRYGEYRLCNDCALRYELAKAEGGVQTIEDFVLTE